MAHKSDLTGKAGFFGGDPHPQAWKLDQVNHRATSPTAGPR
ncbi:hypothetical protein [Pseudonocardia alaniniphila]|nr:hypothetical protein [Pseudonocardia alaniniphila]